MSLALFLLGSLLSALTFGTGGGDAADEVEPPVAGRPPDFTGAIGSGFRVQMRASPTELQAEEPLILTVRITGTGNLQEIPRPNLRRQARFAEQFHIDNLSDRYLPTEKAREFDYRLRPRNAAVREIPSLPFVYFNPKTLPPERGYERTLAPAIPLRVQPRAEVGPGRVEGGVSGSVAPTSVEELVEGARVLRHDSPFTLPGPFELGAILLAPPLLSGLWYIFWLQRYPDAARQARKRRSRAAQQALKALLRCRKNDPVTQAQEAEAVLATYLRQRLDLQPQEPTPAEVARHLEQAGSSPALASEVAGFFRDCDAARFAPGLGEKAKNTTATAIRLLIALEEEPWSSQLS